MRRSTPPTTFLLESISLSPIPETPDEAKLDEREEASEAERLEGSSGLP